MCGRYTLGSPGQVIREVFGLDEAVAIPPRYNIAPSQCVPVVRVDRDSGARTLRSLRWGLHPFWSKAPPGTEARMINARSETVLEKAAFREPFRRRRCLLPADGFYEWKKLDRRKQPHLIRMRDGSPFAFASLWDRWHGPDDVTVESCTILTTGPNELVAEVHDRMPAILPPGEFDRWLDPSQEEAHPLLELLRPYPASEMEAFPVSPRVSNPANDDASLVLPVELPPPPQGDLFG